MDASTKKKAWQTQLLTRLQNPVQLRVFITALVVLGGYLGIYGPLNGEIADTSEQLARARKRLDLTRDIEYLRGQFNRFQARLPHKTDTNEWVQYVLGGIRELPVKMVALDSKAPRDVGPYKAVVLQMELEGKFSDLHSFIRWLEVNERFFRVDGLSFTPHRKQGGLVTMQLTVLGVMG